MKKISYLFAVLLIAGALIARPAHAETSYGDISALLKSLIAQVQELQRQLAIMQKDEALPTISTSSRGQKGYLKLDALNDGGTLKAGETVSIGWGWKAAVENELMELRVKSDTCLTQGALIASGIKNADGYQWEVPSSLVSEKCDYKVYLMVANVKSPNWDYDESDKPFQVVSGDVDVKETIDVASPTDGNAYKKGQAVSLAFTVKSSDGKPDVWINLYKQDGEKEFLVNELFYKYEDGVVSNGENKIAFYPAKGSPYDTDDLYGTFRVEMLVGEITCCKYSINPNDSDFSGWFTIKK